MSLLPFFIFLLHLLFTSFAPAFLKQELISTLVENRAGVKGLKKIFL